MYIVMSEDNIDGSIVDMKAFKEYSKAEEFFYNLIGKLYITVLKDDAKKVNGVYEIKNIDDFVLKNEHTYPTMNCDKDTVEKFIDLGYITILITDCEEGD